MAAKSDFAQKLLHDLRLRKERMAAGEQSSRRGSQASRAVHGNSGRTSKGAQRINAPDSIGSRTGNTSGRSSGSRSININESSNQIVLYESGGQSSRQVRDLTMAIAFAFENSGNLSKIGASNSNPLLNFFNRFGRRSMGGQKMEVTNFNIHGLSINQFPNVSNIQVGELSKGVQKLNQILRSCSSNGFNFDRNSIEVGKELLKGAIDLEESLRILVNLQESSSYLNRSQSKSRIKLLDEDEDDQDDNDKIADQWKLDRPRFSFDKPSRNSYVNRGANKEHQLALSYPDRNSDTNGSKMVHHKRSTSHVQEVSLSTQVKLNGSSSQSPHEKGRISNVIAKLMGLEELPQKEGSKGIKVDLKGKEGKQERVSQGHIKLPEHQYRESGRGSPLNSRKSSLTKNVPPIGEPKLQHKSEKSRDAPGGSFKMASSERIQLQTSVKIPAVSMESVSGQKPASITMNKKQRHATGSNHTSALESFEDSERKQNLTKDKESKVIEMESNKSVLNTEIEQMPQKSKTAKAEEHTHNRYEHKNDKSSEKRNLKSNFPGNQQKAQEPRVTLQNHVPKRTEHPEDKGRAEQRDQQFQKQNLIAKKQEGHHMEMLTASKSKKSTVPILKLSRDKPSPSSEKSLKPTEKVSMGDSPNRRHQEVTPMIASSRETASNQENFKKAGQGHDISPRESQSDMNNESTNQVLAEEKPIEISATQMKAIPRRVQKSEIPQKIDVLVTRRNATMNHLARSRKQPANILKELKQKMQSKNHSSKRMNEQSGDKVNEEKELIPMCDALDMSIEPVSQQDTKSQIEAGQTLIISTSPEADECKIQNTAHLNKNHDATDLKSGKVSDDLQPAKESYAIKDAQKLKECDQIGDLEEDTEPYKLSQHEPKQFPSWARQEQLSEPEKDLKEILIKSQLFLSTAEALFKLNIPVSFLHVGDHDYEVAKKKLVLDSAYEVMKRKARRHEISFHPYLKNTVSYNKVSSLDDLVKKLCKDLEMLKFYGGNEGGESDVAASLYAMLNNDIYDKNSDVNCMWDLEWSKMMLMFPEKDEVIRDIERHMLNGLLDEITNDLLLVTVSV